MRGYLLLKIPTTADPVHVSDVMYVLRFSQVTKPIVSSRIIRFQVKQTNNIVALAVLYVYSEQFGRTNYISIQRRLYFKQKLDHLSPSQLTFMTVDNVKSLIQPLTYTSSDIHGIRKGICTPIHVFKKIYSKNECCNFVSEGILKFLPLFTISTLSNNDVIHRVSVYFKCR